MDTTTAVPDPAAPEAATTAQAGPRPRGQLGRRTPRLAIAVIAASAFCLEMAVSARYGYVRDELYFLAAGRHLAPGYVDQPALTPLIARISAILSGNSLVGLRVVPALGLAALVVMTAAMSRLLGAGRAGQVLAALAAATCGEYIGAMHELTTTMPDFVFWTATLLLVTRLVASQNPRWWLAIGGCVGVAGDAKWNIAFLAASIGAGFLAVGPRHLLRSRYLVIGCAIAVALALPDIVWQAAHGWPNLAVFRALQAQAWHNRVTYWPAQILFTGIALTPIWVAGLIWTLRRGSPGRAFRAVTVACLISIAAQFVLGGKPYYSGAAYSFLLAAGAVRAERWLAGRPPVFSRFSPVTVRAAGLLASAAMVLPVAIPVLPAGVLHSIPLQKINYDLAESIGWPKQVAMVGREYAALPASLRQHTTILAGNYGEAGALDRYGRQFGLPPEYSGANSFWLWGPPPAADTAAIAVNVDPALLRREFAHVRLLTTFWNGLGVSDDEQGARIYLATGLRSSWSSAWPAFRDYS
ncbi:MAG TPA: glycosyltransferase family 39 protein [Streptosporangiaceae bacterium]